ncbi:hypothetical protein JHK82_027458 [Glycine max]|nr:hypothetical protein JHK82_027458 [Glycine max]
MRWSARREIQVLSTWARSNRRSSLTSTTKVSVLMSCKLYHSTCLLSCLVLAPTHLNSTTMATQSLPPQNVAFWVSEAGFQRKAPPTAWE